MCWCALLLLVLLLQVCGVVCFSLTPSPIYTYIHAHEYMYVCIGVCMHRCTRMSASRLELNWIDSPLFLACSFVTVRCWLFLLDFLIADGFEAGIYCCFAELHLLLLSFSLSTFICLWVFASSFTLTLLRRCLCLLLICFGYVLPRVSLVALTLLLSHHVCSLCFFSARAHPRPFVAFAAPQLFERFGRRHNDACVFVGWCKAAPGAA